MPRQFKRLSHSVYECKYHIVFCPKYRYQILRDEVAEYTRQQIYRLCQQKEGVEGDASPNTIRSYSAGVASYVEWC